MGHGRKAQGDVDGIGRCLEIVDIVGPPGDMLDGALMLLRERVHVRRESIACQRTGAFDATFKRFAGNAGVGAYAVSLCWCSQFSERTHAASPPGACRFRSTLECHSRASGAGAEAGWRR